MAAINRQQELTNLTLRELYQKIALTDAEFDDWLRSIGLLPSVVFCDICHMPMTRYRTHFVCNRRPCRSGPTGSTKPRKGAKVC